MLFQKLELNQYLAFPTHQALLWRMLPTAILPLHFVFKAALRGKGCHNSHLRSCLRSSSVEDGCVLGNIPGLWENQMGSHL